MNRVGTAVTVVGIGIAVGAFTAVSYYWQQATHLPEWYVNQSNSSRKVIRLVRNRKIRSAEEILNAKLAAGESDVINASLPGEASEVEVQLNETELNQLVIGAIAEDPNSRQLITSARGFNTTIQNGAIASGAVINLSEIPTHRLGDNEKAILRRAISTFPSLAEREIYIGIEGQPQVEDGLIKFDDSTMIRLGDISLSVAELSKRLGVSQEEIERRLNLELRSRQIDISTIELVEDSAVIRGSAPSRSLSQE